MRDALLQEARIIVSLGQSGISDAHDVFGLEIDVVLDGANRIFVLDRRNHAVKMFGLDGSYLGSIGRAGQGPGEFRDPGALEIMSDGRLVVSDRGNRIKVFSTSNDGYVQSETHRVELVPERACSTADRFFVSGWHGTTETVIHEVPISGKSGASQSFGHGYSADSWIVQDALSDGPIACLSNPPRVVFAFEQIPVVKAYSADDQSLLWAATLGGYTQPPLTELNSGGLAISGRVVQDIVVSLTPVSSRHLLLQTMRLPPSEPGQTIEVDDTETRSYLVDAETGQGALISVSLPVVAVAGVDHYVAMWFLPFPRLELRKWKPPFWNTSLGHE